MFSNPQLGQLWRLGWEQKDPKLFPSGSDNPCKQTLGLSGKLSLDNEGMLFIFEKAGNYGFWMKGRKRQVSFDNMAATILQYAPLKERNA